MLFSSSEHIKVKSFKDDISNNLIESFFKTFKDWYKSKKGFNSFTSATYSDKERRNWLIAA